ncbi:DUF1844 domain-containing protein [Balneolales bacterium ANBcel1]|nr:DUF1844 domain-containing protein [Balneolales bacterium ANBcel1]
MSENESGKVTPEQQDQVLFMMLVQQHQQIAMMGLGEMENPATGKKSRDPKAVKYAVDTLNMLQKFTSGNLTDEMSSYLSDTLKTMRNKYAQLSKPEEE